ncbi:MAG: hypothetical protein HYZ53_09470 [Planctomycetes bacterium]|nr:hypothetical protein [Planctomycetota bacterium]
METVHIEFQRVQTWLFAVPRLRAMVGANTLLGETLRKELPALARNGGGRWSLAPGVDDPTRVLDNPVQTSDPLAPDVDDLKTDAAAGIVSRDGGHFQAQFSTGAKEFADEASARIRRDLPGLRFTVKLDDEPLPRAASALSAELPVLAPCAWTGRGLASVAIRQGSENVPVSLEVSHRHDAAKRAEEDKATDLASLLTRATRLSTSPRPATFEALAGREYLAVIHADGNGVGSGLPKDAPPLQGAVYFHRNRVLLRAALKAAIERCDAITAGEVAPLLLLMLGGDDVLVVCRASVALRFVVDLSHALESLQPEPRSAFHLTLGIGVVLARPSVPFHRLHAVAEALASSAKRKYRGLPGGAKASVVDWTAYTTAWAEDPAEIRARDWVRGSGGDARILSRRPLVVLGNGHATLQGLVAAADELKVDDTPRSQLRYLVDQLARGRALAELAFEELSKPAREALKRAKVTAVWERPDKNGPHFSSLLDLIEVWEIPRLGRAGKPGKHYDEAMVEVGLEHEEVNHG